MKTDKILETYTSKYISEEDTTHIRSRSLEDVHIVEVLSTLEIDKNFKNGQVVHPTESPDWKDFIDS